MISSVGRSLILAPSAIVYELNSLPRRGKILIETRLERNIGAREND